MKSDIVMFETPKLNQKSIQVNEDVEFFEIKAKLVKEVNSNPSNIQAWHDLVDIQS
jgi:hypothetical protein